MTLPKTFSAGERLFASDLNSNFEQLDDETVKVFADAAARTSGIAAPSEGMLSYLADTDAVEVYNGSAWNAVGGGGFTASTAITATDASWTVPTLADPVVRVTVVGAGGAGGEYITIAGNAGGSSSFACSAGTVTAQGGDGGAQGVSIGGGAIPLNGFASANGGGAGQADPSGDWISGHPGGGGEVKVAYLDLTGVTTANVTVGAGGSKNGGTYNRAGGNGVVIVEYRAG